jgi:hypothetical protein
MKEYTKYKGPECMSVVLLSVRESAGVVITSLISVVLLSVRESAGVVITSLISVVLPSVRESAGVVITSLIKKKTFSYSLWDIVHECSCYVSK